MAERNRTTESAWAREAASRGTARLYRLLDRAIEMDGLSAADVYTLGDWIAPLEPDDADCLGLLLVALFLALSEGSLAVELSAAALRRRLDDLGEGGELDPWIEQALTAQRAGRLGHVIGDAADRAANSYPVLIKENNGHRFLYCQKHLRAEEDLDAWLRERIGRAGRKHSDADVAKALNEVLVVAPLRVNGIRVRWDADQLTALGLAMLRDLVIISGGPGTGKTSVVLTLLRCLTRLGIPPERIALAAPTGRAAQRLSDSLRAGVQSLGPDCPAADRALAARSAVTLHSLLEYNPGRNLYRRHEENPIPADVVLVDEVSMVGVDQMASLLHALEPTAKLILLGDKDQLPSVEAGAVLGQLAPDGDAPALSEPVRRQIEKWFPDVGTLAAGDDHWLRDSVVLLRTNHRSEKGIRDVAQAINAQRASIIGDLPRFSGQAKGDWMAAEERGGVWWWPQAQATAAELRGHLQRWAENVYDGVLPGGRTLLDLVQERTLAASDLGSAATVAWLDRLFQALERARLLTLVRESAWGCGPINEMMQGWLRRRSQAGRERDWLPGTPILITRNDRMRELYNGDVGLTLAGPGGARMVVFARQGRYVALAPDNLPSHELGFALTVHKSQGSEYQQAFVVLPPAGARRLLTKELLYTALTRAKKLAVVSATEEAFRAAVGRRIVRESGLRPSG
jgi:exodeoxyribonuclease V alpha subunit